MAAVGFSLETHLVNGLGDDFDTTAPINHHLIVLFFMQNIGVEYTRSPPISLPVV